MGNLFGQGVNGLLGDWVAGPGAYANRHGRHRAAVQQAPLTAMVMLFELTNDYTIMLPLMIACILASLLAKRALGKTSTNENPPRRSNFRGRDQNVLRTVRVLR